VGWIIPAIADIPNACKWNKRFDNNTDQGDESMAQGTKQAKKKDDIQLESNKETQTPPSRQAGFNQASGLQQQGRSDQRMTQGGRYSPGSPSSFLDNLRSEIDRLFDEFGFGRGLSFPSFGSFTGVMDWSPQTEVFQRDNEMVVRADLPGLSKDDIDIEIEDDQLTIRGERRSEHEEDRQGFYSSERSYGSFYRSIPLPRGVNGDEAAANFENGVLEITLPIPEQASRGRRIEIGQAKPR
jgi:HSP20 family protein